MRVYNNPITILLSLRHIVSVQFYVNIVQQTCRPLTIIIINEFSVWSCFERGSNARQFLFRKIKFKVYALRGGRNKKEEKSRLSEKILAQYCNTIRVTDTVFVCTSNLHKSRGSSEVYRIYRSNHFPLYYTLAKLLNRDIIVFIKA